MEREKAWSRKNIYYLYTGFARYRSKWAWGGGKTEKDKQISTTCKYLLEIDENGTVNVARSVFYEDASGEFGVADDIPCPGLLGTDFSLVIDDAGGAPHVGDGIIVGIDVRIDFPEHLEHVGRFVQCDVVDGVRDGREVEGKDEPVVEHALDDVIRRVYDIVVFMSLLDL